MNEKRVKNETPDEDGLSMTPSQEFISIDVDENSMSSIDLGINLLNFDANILEKYAKIRTFSRVIAKLSGISRK